MSKEEELSRVYTINLAKVWLSPENRRTKRAINMIKEFATRHMKAEEIKIDEELNRQIWKRGIRHPPRKVRVKMTKDEDDIVTVSPYSEEVKEEVEEKPAAVEAAIPATVSAAGQEAVEEVATEKPEEKVPKVEKAAEVEEEKTKPKKEEEPEKIVLSEEDLAEIVAEEEGAEEEKGSKGKRKK